MLSDGGDREATAGEVADAVRALNEANRRLIEADTREAVASVFSDAAESVLGFPGTSVRLYDPDRDALVHQSFGGTVGDIESRPTFRVDASPHGRAFDRGETVVDTIEPEDPYDREAFVQTMYVPIGDHGVLSVGKTDGEFTPTEREFAEVLARNARAAFDRAEHEAELEATIERLEWQNERLERLAGVISHDLRNPLNVAMGHVAGLDGETDAVERSLERIERLVDEVLTMVKGSRSVEETEPVALAGLAEDCWEVVDTADASLRVETDAVVEADPARLRHVFENLFGNAVEHGSTNPDSQTRRDAVGQTSDEPSVADAPEDAVEHGSTSPGSQSRQDAVEHGSTNPASQAQQDAADVTVRVGTVDSSAGDTTGFFVADDGTGIPAEEREAVFDSGYTTDRDGTGFGLAIVRDMVEAHGWSVAVTESEAGGARFEITGVHPAP